MTDWVDETYGDRTRFGVRIKRALFRGQSEFQSVDVVESLAFGKALMLGGTWQTSVGDEHFYHELLVHPAMTTAPKIARVLVIGGGDGGTVREVLRYPEVEHVTMCELDKMVTDVCREHMPEFNVPWDDPRLTLLFRDGVAFLKESGPRYDVILLDGPDPVGPAAGLFQSPFYEAAKRRLSPDGVFATQSESPVAMREEFLTIVQTLRGTFERVAPYFGPVPIYPSGTWSWTFASRSVDPVAILEARAEIAERTSRYYNRDVHRAAFAVPTEFRRLWAAK
jgi:spermidine synthase